MAKKGNKKVKDPYAAREAMSYDNPIPSREYILTLLKEAEGPLAFDEIASRLSLKTEDDIEALSRRLKAMCRDGQVMRSRKDRYGLIDRMHLIAGHVEAKRDGHGFFFPELGGEPYFVPARDMYKVMHGDKVLVREGFGTIRGRKVANIVEVTERKHQFIAGRYFKERGMGSVEPDSQFINQAIVVAPNDSIGAKHGQMVMVELIAPPSRHVPAMGKVVEVLGEYLAPGMETDIAIRSHALPHLWSDACLKEAAQFGDKVDSAVSKGRVDLRDKHFVTIDGEDAKDFDDAIYAEKMKGGYKLWVAIADVSHYVKPGSALDEEALERGNSVYFPKRVIPMLPESLSNGLCSLRPKVDRLVLVCEMDVMRKGCVKAYDFYPAVIHSKARLTYTTVAEILEYKNETVREQHTEHLESLETLYELFHALHDFRMAEGSLYFEVPQPQCIFDEHLKLKKIIPSYRNDAHCIVEECMLAANVCAGEYILESGFPGVYRVHPGPKPDKIADLQSYLKMMGLHLGGELKPEPYDYAKLVASVEHRPDATMIQMQLLRSLQQAYYSVDCSLHFGLAFETYTHFTSPIRRYPDLLVHRLIKAISESKNAPYSESALRRMTQHCSQTERRADMATREVMAWLKCELMLERVGEEFTARISGITAFGFFVELKGMMVEGLVHISSLDNDYYTFDAVKQCLYGERSGFVYQLGDQVKVRLARVSLESRQIDFDLVKRPVAEKKKPKKQQNKKHKPKERKKKHSS